MSRGTVPPKIVACKIIRVKSSLKGVGSYRMHFGLKKYSQEKINGSLVGTTHPKASVKVPDCCDRSVCAEDYNIIHDGIPAAWSRKRLKWARNS